MKTLIIGDRIFDPAEIEHLELVNTTLYVYYNNSNCVSKVKFDSFEEAAVEFYVLPDYIRKIYRKR